uniref:Carnitine deficiency-associated gene expressed in ventricle 3 n=1 Tax=Hucho hucho TaxID=62062 RepID=A0A4W5MJF1_9TELE
VDWVFSGDCGSDEKEEEEYEEEVGEDGEIILVSGDKMSGPWNKSGAPPPAAVEEVPESKPSGVYRPPGARLTTTKRGPNQGPPEIFSDTQFPSLRAGSKHVETRRDREMEKTFELVKHKNRGREEGGSGVSLQQLELGNQYAILGDK